MEDEVQLRGWKWVFPARARIRGKRGQRATGLLANSSGFGQETDHPRLRPGQFSEHRGPGTRFANSLRQIDGALRALTRKTPTADQPAGEASLNFRANHLRDDLDELFAQIGGAAQACELEGFEPVIGSSQHVLDRGR
ncbi:MAG TPA: hypothetical protein VMJ93_16380 [Verrucomicrobiae bacterium]|nr:hypothetical protein [Verrucomicrobiae bacterium]